MQVKVVALLLVALLALLLSSAPERVEAESLRNAITFKVAANSALYDRMEAEAALNPDDPLQDVADLFNTTDGNFTQPEDAWRALPKWAQYTVGIIIMLIGIFVTFFGVRFLPFSIFLLGGLMAGVLMWAILAASVSNSNPDKTAIVYGTAGATWIVFGCLFACCVKLAVFILGFAAGAVLSLALNPIALKYAWPEEPLGNLLIFFFAFGIVGGIIACFLKKTIMIIATASGGAFLTVASLMAMVGSFNLAVDSGTDEAPPTSWQDYVGFAGMICMAFCGIVIQLCVTARKDDFEGYSKLD